MKKIILAAALSTLTVSSAFAFNFGFEGGIKGPQEVSPQHINSELDYPPAAIAPYESKITRAQAVEERDQTIARNLMPASETDYPVLDKQQHIITLPTQYTTAVEYYTPGVGATMKPNRAAEPVHYQKQNREIR